jgi:hypothetical protein
MTTPATYIRDQVLARITNLYPWKTVRKVPTVTTLADQFPRLGVYLVRETENPDGDGNVGRPRYIDDTVVAISVMDNLSKPEVLEGSVDAMIDNIKNTLLQDISMVSLKDPSGVIMIDSIPSISRNYSFPNNGETYFIECRLQMTFRFNVYYEPIMPHWLEQVAVDVRPNNDPVPVGDPFIIDLPTGESEP